MNTDTYKETIDTDLEDPAEAFENMNKLVKTSVFQLFG